MVGVLLALGLITALMLLCTSTVLAVQRALRGDGRLPTTINDLADRSIARAAMADIDREYEELLAREGRR